jgi:hypothetical protein
VLHTFLGKPLDEFVGKKGASMAGELIKTLNEGVLSAVKTKISAHHKVFEEKPSDEKKKLLDASRQFSLFLVTTSTPALAQLAAQKAC